MESKNGPEIERQPQTTEGATDKESLSTKETLPQPYKEALSELKENVPQEFRDQARMAAYYFWSLDTGRKLVEGGTSTDEKVRRMADQIARSGFAQTAYIKAEYPALTGESVDPKKALPWWVNERVTRKREEPLSGEEVDNLVRFHTGYGEENGQQFGAHYLYEDGTRQIDGVSNFKFYLERKALKDPEKIKSALNALKEEGIHPNQSKLYDERRLVFYWRTPLEKNLQNEIEEVFEDVGICPRGPAQDPVGAEVENEGSTQYMILASNDESLGEGMANPFVWREDEYDQKEFFKQYLRLTFFKAKNPAEPYKQSFIPIFGRVASEDALEEVKKLIEDSQHLPVFTIPGYHIDSPFEV